MEEFCLNKRFLPSFTVINFNQLLILLGITGSNIRDGFTTSNEYLNIDSNQAYKMIEHGILISKDRVFVLDVRTPNEYKYGHIKGATLIPLINVQKYDPVNLPDKQLLPNRLDELPKNKDIEILVYCKTGNRGSTASQLIVNKGYRKVHCMQSGLDSWVKAGYPIIFDPTAWEAHHPPKQ